MASGEYFTHEAQQLKDGTWEYLIRYQGRQVIAETASQASDSPDAETWRRIRLMAAAPMLLRRLLETVTRLERLDAAFLAYTGAHKDCELGEVRRARDAIIEAIGAQETLQLRVGGQS